MVRMEERTPLVEAKLQRFMENFHDKAGAFLLVRKFSGREGGRDGMEKNISVTLPWNGYSLPQVDRIWL